MDKSFSCPSCGAGVVFKTSIAVSTVCPFCRSLIVRHDKDVKSMGKMAEVPQDISPFQIGTEGIFNSVHFTLIGRMKIGWEDGCWNEWFVYFDSGKRGWLAEAQGSLAMSYELEEQEAPDEHPKLGKTVSLGGIDFKVTDIKQTYCISCEGELPLAVPAGRKAQSYDLMSKNGDFASMEYAAPDPIRIYVGEYVEFDDLRFSNLRELPGWDVKMAGNKANG